MGSAWMTRPRMVLAGCAAVALVAAGGVWASASRTAPPQRVPAAAGQAGDPVRTAVPAHDKDGDVVDLGPRSPAPRAVTQGVQQQAASPAAALDTTADVYYLEDGGSAQIRRLNRGVTLNPGTIETGSGADIAWSADGARLAIARPSGVVTQVPGGFDEIEVDATGSAGAVAWSPTGEQIAHWDGDGAFRLLESDGSAGRTLPVAGVTDPSSATYTLDGQHLVVTDATGDAEDRLLVVDLAGEDAVRRLLPDDASADDAGVEQRDAVRSPDGSRLAYVQEAANGATSVWVMSPDGSNADKVTDATLAPGGVGWTADGTHLYLLVTAPSNRLQTVPVEGGTPTTLVADLPNSVSTLTVQPPAPAVTFTRRSGADRVATSVAISAAAFSAAPGVGTPSCAGGNAESAVIARSDLFPDGLAAAPLAAARCAPLLLTPPTTYDTRVRAEIRRILAPGRTVYIIGSTGAIAASTEAAIRADGYSVTRYAGASRYDTAVKIAEDGLGSPDTVFLADGTNFPDALVAGPAAAGYGAVLLTNAGAPAEATTNYIAQHATATVAVGGPAATAYPTAFAVAGANRYDTAALVAKQYFGPPTSIMLASGTAFPDALSGGAWAAVTGQPLLTTPGTVLNDTIGQLIDAGSAAARAVYVFGGATVVVDAVGTEAAAIARGR